MKTATPVPANTEAEPTAVGPAGQEAPATPADNEYQLEYRATRAALSRISISYRSADGGTEELQTQGDTWSATVTVASGFEAELTVQHHNAIQGRVTCEIYLDGALWKSGQSEGPSAAATCSGVVG